MKINLKQVLQDLSGKDIKNDNKDFTLGEALSNILVSNETGGKMKLFILAKKCFTGNTLEVDLSDLNLIKEAVKTTKIYTALVAGQCEEILEEVKTSVGNK